MVVLQLAFWIACDNIRDMLPTSPIGIGVVLIFLVVMFCIGADKPPRK